MGMIEQGKDLLNAVELMQNGQVVAAPGKGAHTFRMRKGVTYHGDREAAVKALSMAFPECTFSWEDAPPAGEAKPAKVK